MTTSEIVLTAVAVIGVLTTVIANWPRIREFFAEKGSSPSRGKRWLNGLILFLIGVFAHWLVWTARGGGFLDGTGIDVELYGWHHSENSATKTMLRTSEGLCFLTRYSGGVGVDQGWVTVYPVDGRWTLTGYGAVAGEAHCWRFPWDR